VEEEIPPGWKVSRFKVSRWQGGKVAKKKASVYAEAFSLKP